MLKNKKKKICLFYHSTDTKHAKYVKKTKIKQNTDQILRSIQHLSIFKKKRKKRKKKKKNLVEEEENISANFWQESERPKRFKCVTK